MRRVPFRMAVAYERGQILFIFTTIGHCSGDEREACHDRTKLMSERRNYSGTVTVSAMYLIKR